MFASSLYLTPLKESWTSLPATSLPAITPIPHTTYNNNHPPSVTNQSITTSTNKAVDIVLAGNDPDSNSSLTANIVSPPSHGKLSSINQNTGVVTYTPNSNFTGSDSFTFKVNDGEVDSSNTGTVNIKVGAL